MMRTVINRTITGILVLLALIVLPSCEVGDNTSPAPVSNFQYICDSKLIISECIIPDTRTLAWIASGDDKYRGRAFQYDIRFNTVPVTDANFDAAYQLVDEPIPSASGTIDTILLPRLHPQEYFYYGIRAIDEVGNKSTVASIGLPAPTPFISVPLMTSDAVAAGGSNPAGYGTSLANIGSMDGSKKTDFAIGAPGADGPVNPGTGAVYITYNYDGTEYLASTGLITYAALQRTESAKLYGEATGDEFGTSIIGAFDFNGDEYGDIAISAPGVGRVYIFYGGNTGLSIGSIYDLSLSQADVTIQGPTGTAGSFGKAIAAGGILNNVAGDELAIGSPDENGGAGAVYVFYGGLVSTHTINNTGGTPVYIDLDLVVPDVKILGRPGARLGESFPSNPADLNNDLYDELVIGAPGEGAVFVFYGSYGQDWDVLDFRTTGGITFDMNTADADLEIFGPASFGTSISVRGDVNDGGEADLAIGAPDSSSVHVFYGETEEGVIDYYTTKIFIIEPGRSADITIIGPSGTDFGQVVDITGDFNGDRIYDILVGMPDAGVGEGKVFCFLGSNEAGALSNEILWSDAFFEFTTPEAGSSFGSRIITLGDLVEDQALSHFIYDEMLISAPTGANPTVLLEF